VHCFYASATSEYDRLLFFDLLIKTKNRMSFGLRILFLKNNPIFDMISLGSMNLRTGGNRALSSVT
jgi:hypothetical protein